MDVLEAIYRRRAVREFTSEAVDEEMLLKLIAAAVQAPSSMNQQSWSFFVIRDRALLDRISRAAKAHMVKPSPRELMPDKFDELFNDPNFDIFYHAPVLVVVASMAASPWAVEDCALAAENLMLAACALGLGTCWIGFAQGWLRTPEGKAALHMPPNCMPVAPIIVGHPKKALSPVPRKDPEVHWVGS